tara:strand:+ start:656 stop:1771 length:1116 start_codon:yes stop_codon:yes gene_type:complete
MILGIDATNIKSDGGQVHLFEILNNFNFRNSKINKIIVWGNFASLNKIKKNKNITKIYIKNISNNSVYRLIWQFFFLPKQLKFYNCNILFVLGGVLVRKSTKTVSIFQNILPFINDDIERYNFLTRVKLRIQKKIYLNTFKNSDGLIFLSNYSQRILKKEMNLQYKRKMIIPHGVSKIFKFKNRKNRKNRKNIIKILYVSKIDLYKNQVKILEVIDLLKNKFNLKLSLVGSYDYKNKNLLLDKIYKLKIVDQVQILGRLKYKDLPRLYHSHDLKIYASKSETFGMTMLEAMKCGLPVLATKTQISREILSNAGFFCKDSIFDISNALENIIKKNNFRKKILQGKKISEKYSWKITSKNTFKFIEDIGSKID